VTVYTRQDNRPELILDPYLQAGVCSHNLKRQHWLGHVGIQARSLACVDARLLQNLCLTQPARFTHSVTNRSSHQLDISSDVRINTVLIHPPPSMIHISEPSKQIFNRLLCIPTLETREMIDQRLMR